MRIVFLSARWLYEELHSHHRFVSGFLTLRGIGLRTIYRTRNLSLTFRRFFSDGPLIEVFDATLKEVEQRGPFDTHLQSQTTFLGPSNTIQNEFAGGRDPSKVTHWVPIRKLDDFCLREFGAKPPRKNQANKVQEGVLKTDLEKHPELSDRIRKLYQADLIRHTELIGGSS